MALIRLHNELVSWYHEEDETGKGIYHSKLADSQSDFFMKFLNGAGFFKSEMEFLSEAYDKLERENGTNREIRGYNARLCRAKTDFNGTLAWYYVPMLVGFREDSREDVEDYDGDSAVGIIKCFPSDIPRDLLSIPPEMKNFSKAFFLSTIIETPLQLFLNFYDGLPASLTSKSRGDSASNVISELREKGFINFTEPSDKDPAAEYEENKKRHIIQEIYAHLNTQDNVLADKYFKKVNYEEVEAYFAQEKIPNLDTIYRSIPDLGDDRIRFPNNEELTKILGWYEFK